MGRFCFLVQAPPPSPGSAMPRVKPSSFGLKSLPVSNLLVVQWWYYPALFSGLQWILYHPQSAVESSGDRGSTSKVVYLHSLKTPGGFLQIAGNRNEAEHQLPLSAVQCAMKRDTCPAVTWDVVRKSSQPGSSSLNVFGESQS